MKRTIICCFLLFILAASCQEIPVERDPNDIVTSRLTESESAILARAAIQEVTGQQLVQVNWLTLRGDLVFAIDYATDLDLTSQPEAFSDQFNRVAFIASEFFHKTNTQAVNIIVMAEDIDFPTADRNPPLYQVVIERGKISPWINGETTDSAFIESWFVVPLEVFPTPGSH